MPMPHCIVKNPLTAGHRARRRTTRSRLARVMQNQERIEKLRDLDLSWRDIAQHLGMSTASLRRAVKQVYALKPDEVPELPNGLHPKLTLPFPAEADRLVFIHWARVIQGEEDVYDESA